MSRYVDNQNGGKGADLLEACELSILTNESEGKSTKATEHGSVPMSVFGIRLCGHYDDSGRWVVYSSDWDEEGDDYDIY